MIKEKDYLELLKDGCDWYYYKTQDEWYKKISKQIEKKLKKGGKKWENTNFIK